MPPGETLDDDYVVSLLLKDAEANKKRYLTKTLGSSFLSQRSRSNAPKPNTRFLKNIIKETDSHNAALKAKEEEESKARLKDIRKNSSKKRVREEDGEGSSKRRKGDDKPGRWASALGGLSGRSERSSGKRANDADGGGSKHPHRDRWERSRERHSDRSRRHQRNDDDERNWRPRSRSREAREPRRRRSASSPSRSPQKQPTVHPHDSDSDPLDEFLGPKPPPKVLPRGRGAFKPSSSINARFDPSYNPKTDVDLSPDDGERDDWDMAIEALRDRAKWRAQGAERLRDAGFTEDEVRKWEGNSGLRSEEDGVQKDVEDVRWRKRGEGREWDRGKVMSEDGRVDVRPEWGRLKGT